ncbi:MAG: hypothetical protein JST26_14810 [Bacteroidetes bacterium]|nr:hypothetical protein [Bacteroidota bacterium]
MKPKFTLDRPKVSEDEINKHKDFDSLVKQFKEQSIEKARSDVNFLKNKKVTYTAVIAGVAVICTLTYFTVFKKPASTQSAHDKINTSQSQSSSSTKFSKPSTAFINPPSAKIAVPYSSYKVDAVNGGEIKHPSQSKIKIPQKAFVNKQGQDIVGEIEIKYREFHNQAEIIASGIPMTYDSAGTQYHFESAGMFDIKGYQNGEPVYVKPGKTLTVELASQQSGNHYNQYELDTLQHQWTCIKKDVAVAFKGDAKSASPATSPGDVPASPKMKQLQSQLDVIPPRIDSVKTVYNKKINQLPAATQPAKPTKANQNRPQFELDVDYKEFPELAAFKNAVFEVGEENKNYTKDLAGITWGSAEISEGPQKGKNYLLTLKLRERVEKLVVYPALTGASYDAAIKQYDKKLADYNSLLTKRLADEKRLKDEMEAKQKAYIEEQKKLTDAMLKEQIRIRQEMQKQFESTMNILNNTAKVTRVFQISHFGICNSDCPSSMPRGAMMEPMFVEASQPINPYTVYLVEHGRNIVFNLSTPGAIKHMSYDPTKDYTLCVLSGSAIYTCSKDVFKAVAASGKNTLPLVKLPDNVDNTGDFKTALGI